MMPPIRRAIIPSRVKYNKTGSAAQINWGWKTVEREVLQYRDAQGVWHDIPTERLPLDDSAERAEQDAADQARQAEHVACLAYVAMLRDTIQREGGGNALWVVPKGNDYGHFLDSHNALFGWTPEEDGYTYYTTRKGLKIARTCPRGHQVLASAYADWLDPALNDLQQLRARLEC